MMLDLLVFDAPTLRRMWDEFAQYLIGRGTADDHEIVTLNWIALAYGEKLGVCVFLSGRNAT